MLEQWDPAVTSDESDDAGVPDDEVTVRTAEVLSGHTPPGGLTADPGRRLSELADLRERGLLTEDEYRLHRQHLLDTI